MSAFFKIVLVGAFLSRVCLGLEVRDYDPARHDRFVGFPSNLAANEGFFLGEEDWSGFGWNVEDSRKHFTLISPKHFVGAWHFRPAVGQRVRFVNRSGEVKTYTVAARHDIANDEIPSKASDLFVGELVESVLPEDEISLVPVYNLPNEADYLNLQLVASGRSSRAGLGSIATIKNFGGEPGLGINETRGLTTVRVDPGESEDGFFFVTGDSGGPSAFLSEDGFALVGTHSTIEQVSVMQNTTYRNTDTFVPHYLDRLDEVMASEGYHVKRFHATAPNLAFTLTAPSGSVLTSEGADYQFLFANGQGAEAGHNLRLVLSFDAGASFSSHSGSGWFVESETEMEVVLVRAGLLPGEASPLTVALSLPNNPTGAVTQSAALSADGSASLMIMETTEVVQSYPSWAVGLGETGLMDDPDGDGLSNLLEFALGRDGGRVDSGEFLSLEGGESGLELSYQQRASLDLLDLLVWVEASSDLEEWAPIEQTAPVEIVSEGYLLDSVILAPNPLERRFFRLQVAFGENLVF